MEADQLGRLRDILHAARLIASYARDTTEEQFTANTEKQDAVIRRLEIIGEATVHLSDVTRLLEAIHALESGKGVVRDIDLNS